MQTSQKHHHSSGFDNFYQTTDSRTGSDNGSTGSHSSYPASNVQIFTLESYDVTDSYMAYDSPVAASVSSYMSPVSFSSQGSQSILSEHYRSPENTCESLFTGYPAIAENPSAVLIRNQIIERSKKLGMKELLIWCAQAVSGADSFTAAILIDMLDQRVSVCGEPIQRVGAYMLEGLKARLEESGIKIYRSLHCNEPTSPELLTSMGLLYQICPYWKFAYLSANVVIGEAAENESRIHILDFQIAQGSQWALLIQALAQRPGGPPHIRITGVDDHQSTKARGGGLEMVGEKLSKLAASLNVPFEFHDAEMTDFNFSVQLQNLLIYPSEALIVNFPYVLHHMADESVSTVNHRDQLLRLIKGYSPKVVTLIEQESNTNTAAFVPRFIETLDYYTAMFESIDVKLPKDDDNRIRAEQNCVARDIVNMIACEGAERVERHEVLGKWRARLSMAGFTQYPLSPTVAEVIKNMLNDYSGNYKLAEDKGALILSWKNRAMSTSSAWR
uniref:Uncharacterized protein n=1 Tax=Kalanchoe fedtschenkoi TaxID=63787 RepID=A0A7N1A1H8_KALFE